VFHDDIPVIETLAKDAEGNIWYGSKKGLLRSYGNYISFLNLKEELGDNNIFALTIDAKERLWLSTKKGLFVRSKNKNGDYSMEKPLKGTSYENLFIISLYADADGYIWAGSYGQGL
jgi:ligand-binding sensor domain-containing protein